jgi:hypothetical protein
VPRWQYTSVVHVDSYGWRLLGCRYSRITCNERSSNGTRIHACHHRGIITPLMGSTPIIHHGGHCSISNCVAKKIDLESSQRVTLLLFSDGSIMVLCFILSRPNNERLVQLARDGVSHYSLTVLHKNNIGMNAYETPILRTLKHCIYKSFTT